MDEHASETDESISFPHTPLRRWTRPLVRFLHTEAASGVLLLLGSCVAMVMANSPWSENYVDFWHTETGLVLGDYHLTLTLEHWVNEGLMTLFFFVVGLEIKREMIFGELRDLRRASLPILGALGGMLVPASIYIVLQSGQPGATGWGIPMATDIAFVVGILALLGPRVPYGLKIFLLCLAIADDIGAVLVIALFYSGGLALPALAGVGAGFALIAVFNRIGIRSVKVYFAVGAGIWLAMLRSGIHPTVAGVLLGLLTPVHAWMDPNRFQHELRIALEYLRGSPTNPARVAEPLFWIARESLSPLQRLEEAWHPWVAFGIMPLFALANAGVTLNAATFQHPVVWAVLLGLLLGKPIGIVAASWLGVRLGLARLPTGVPWQLMLAGGCLGGIGFTMSLFITGLAFDDAVLLDAGKVGTLIGSACSAVFGYIWVVSVLPKVMERTQPHQPP